MNYFSVGLGVLFGISPVTSYFAPILIVALSVGFSYKKVDWSAILSSFFVMQYCIVHLFLALFHDDFPFRQDYLNVLAIIAVSAPFVVTTLRSERLSKICVERGIFAGFSIAFGLLAYQYFIIGECRVSGLTFNPLLPPFLWVPLTFALLAFRLVARRTNAYDFVGLISTIVAVGAFMGARSAFYVSIVLSLALILMAAALKLRRGFVSLAAALALSLAAVYAIDRCGMSQRIDIQLRMLDICLWTTCDAQVHSDAGGIDLIGAGSKLQKPPVGSDYAIAGKAPQDSSVETRWHMWGEGLNALQAFGVEWLVGVGFSGEMEIITTGYQHVHNQFLSWLISTGLVGFLSAFLLFFGLIAKIKREKRVLIYLAAVGGGLFTDSLMRVPDGLALFLLILIFVQIWSERALDE